MVRNRIVYIAQLEGVECGAACLCMILGYYGHHAPLVEVRDACCVSRDGASGAQLVAAASSFGLGATGMKLAMDQLKQIAAPCILHWDFNHFVVLERCTKAGAVIVDPAYGRRTMAWAELSLHYTGIAFLFSPTTALTARAYQHPSLDRYLKIIKENKRQILKILTISLGFQGLSFAFPVATYLLVDRMIVPRQHRLLYALAFGLLGAVLGRAMMALARGQVILRLRRHLDLALMGGFIYHLLHLPLEYFLHRQVGDLVQRVQSNTVVRNLLSNQSISALLDGMVLLGYACYMLVLDWRLGVVVILVSSLRVAMLGLLKDRNRQLLTAEMALEGQEYSALVEALTGMETTHAIRAEARMVMRWSNRMTKRLNANIKRRRLVAFTNQFLLLLQGATLASVFLFGGIGVQEGRMTLGCFAAFLTIQGLLMSPLGALLDTITQLQYLTTNLQRLDDVLDAPLEASGQRRPGRLNGAIELDHVDFGYSKSGLAVIKDIVLTIGSGEKIAIVGPSGAGKSTLARLLLGHHLPTCGSVRFDGHDLREFDIREMRQQMGVVLQEMFFFNDTVAANVTSYNQDIPRSDIWRALELACLDEVVKALPQGLDTQIGENASSLSGGQRQRLNLARALVRRPSILLLDEATSSLDPATEQRVHRNLSGLGCTRIVIAHRMATVQDSDRIVVVQSGRIVQEGKYEHLVAATGPFREMVFAAELFHA